MADSLNLIRAKLGRAQDLIVHLHDMFRTHPDAPFYGLGFEIDRDGRRFVVRARDVQEFPTDYPFLIGEIAHQLRSSLDHLAFALARPTTERQKDFVKFPLCSTGKNFKRQIKKGALVGAPRGVLGRVERVQPYHRKKWPDTQLLGYLQAISNWDKHRTLTVAATRIEEIAVEIIEPKTLIIVAKEQFRGLVKENKIITRFEVRGDIPPEANIKTRNDVVMSPVFDERGPKKVAGKRVVVTLEQTRTLILNEVLPLFEPFFQ